jgi:dynein heavy chain 2
MPVLKWVRGEPLSQDHWLELFRMLKMPRGTTLEKLTFGHVLNASDNIITNADALKVILWFLTLRYSHVMSIVYYCYY